MILLSTGELSCQGRSASERGRGGCTSPQRAAEPARESRLSRRQSPGREDTASRLPSALPGPRASRQSRGPPPRSSRAGAAATARRGRQRRRNSLRAGMEVGRRALGARRLGSPFPLRLPAALPPRCGQGPLRAALWEM